MLYQTKAKVDILKIYAIALPDGATEKKCQLNESSGNEEGHPDSL